MLYRQLGESELNVSAVTFGAWAIGGWMWGGADEGDAIAAIREAVELGVNTIDTAAVYGFGKSEELVAKALADVKRQDVLLLTKYGLRWDRPESEGQWYFDSTDDTGKPVKVHRNSLPASVIEECERSLRRLKTDYIDLYQCHWPDPTTPIEDTMAAIAKLIEQGKVLAAGVSNYDVEQMERAAACLPLASSQPPYSMVQRQAEQDVLPWCREHNVGVVAYNPMQRGLLTGKITEDYEFGEGDHRRRNSYFRPDNVRKVNAMLEEIRPIAEAHGATFAQLAVNWAIHQPGVTAALVGARNVKQVRENAKAADFTLADDEMAQINELLDALELDA